MNDLEKLRDDLASLVTSFTAGDWKAAWQAEINVQQDFYNLSGLFFATAETAPVSKECVQHCEKLKSELAKAGVMAAPASVDAIGDGTFLKIILPLLLDALMKWLSKP